jgi:hypothetical protein
MNQYAFLFLSIISLPISLFSQDKISTELPDQSYSADLMDAKKFQLETSLYYNSIKENPNPVIVSSLLRYGLKDKIELRLLVEQGDHRDIYITETAHATYPLAFGAKFELLEEKKGRPGVALVAYVQLPFTNFDKQNSQWSPAFIGAIEKRISNFTITCNTGIKEQAFEHTWESVNTADLKYELSEKVQVFTEYFGEYQAHESPLHNVDAGMMLVLGKNYQVHLAGGTSVAHHPGYYFVNTGIACRL